MVTLTDKQKNDYLHRSYSAVDGLWFMKVEERFGFEAALDIDQEVWKVLPKIQARKLKELTGLGQGLEALREVFSIKLQWDGFAFDAHYDAVGRCCTFTVGQCPWQAMLKKSGREHLAERIAERICQTEYALWASEFGPGIHFKLIKGSCQNGSCCQICFSEA